MRNWIVTGSIDAQVECPPYGPTSSLSVHHISCENRGWTSFRIVQDPASNQGTWYADGGVPADAAIHPNSTAPFSIGVGIGAPGSPNTQSFFKGFIDEARITKGVARYTSNFARPTQPFPSH